MYQQDTFMIKKFLITPIVFLLVSCASPGTALLGPAFTGALTKSVSQTSLSYGTNHIVKKIHDKYKEKPLK